ncbi:MAG: hypothetical protein JKY46_08155 [Robiginitomaculum sp.]|nr:hypothetical protein [Robiginitomaculum sp.]
MFGDETNESEEITTAAEEEEQLEKALHRAHDLRKFELELYWKRATYFWAFQAIAFTLFGLLISGDSLSSGSIPKEKLWLLIPAVLGAVTALAGHFTAKGSKFWQKNWEAHVDILEETLKIRSTLVVLSDEPTSYSVSKINQNLMGFFALMWVSLFLIIAAYLIYCFVENDILVWILSVLVAGITILIFFLFRKFEIFTCIKSNLPGWEYIDEKWTPLENDKDKDKNKDKWRITFRDPSGWKRSDPSKLKRGKPNNPETK